MKQLFTWFLFMSLSAMHAQDIDSLMENLTAQNKQELVVSTFKSTKLVLLQTNETQKKYNLTILIGHRFGDIGGDSGGIHSLFGLDFASDIYIGANYGITNDLTLGVGRSRYNETYNFLAKYRLLEQAKQKTPLSISLFAQSSWITREEFVDQEFPDQADRISYFFQVIFAKKFSPAFSFMLSPGYLLRSQVEDPLDNENIFALGVGGRIKLTRTLSIIADYTWINGLGRPADLESGYTNPLGVGLEIQTGGHVFSLNFQNSRFITENNFIPNTTSSWGDGEFRFGFTITRNFYLGPKDRGSQTDS